MWILLLFLIVASPLVADDKSALLQTMDARAAHYGEVSRKIWEFAEVGYKENRSAELLKSELRSAGFTLADRILGAAEVFSASIRMRAARSTVRQAHSPVNLRRAVPACQSSPFLAALAAASAAR